MCTCARKKLLSTLLQRIYLITQELHLLRNIDNVHVRTQETVFYVRSTHIIPREFHLLWNIDNVLLNTQEITVVYWQGYVS